MSMLKEYRPSSAFYGRGLNFFQPVEVLIQKLWGPKAIIVPGLRSHHFTQVYFKLPYIGHFSFIDQVNTRYFIKRYCSDLNIKLVAAYKLLFYHRRSLFVCVSRIGRPSGRNWVGLYEGDIRYGGHCCFQYMYRTCNIFPQLTVASWLQFSR